MTEPTLYRSEGSGTVDDRIPTPEEEESTIDIVELMMTLNRGRMKIIFFALVAFALGTAAAFLIPPEYTSKASLIPPNTNSSSTAAALVGQLSQISGLGAGSLLGGKSPSDLYVGILKSRSIAAEIVKRFDLMSVYRVKKESEAEKRLASNSKFEVGTKDSIVTISVTDKSASRAHDIANAYLESLRDANGRLALNESSQRRLFFSQQLAKEKDNLENAEVALKETEEKTGLVAPTAQTASEIQIIAQTRAEIAVREVELSALRQSATEQNPEMIRLQSEITDLRGQLSLLQKGNAKNETGGIPTSMVPEVELDYVRKTREVKYHEALFEMLARQLEAARLDESHDPPLLQVLDPASYPDTRSFPPRILIMLGALLFGCLAGSGWVLASERFAMMRASFACKENTSLEVSL